MSVTFARSAILAACLLRLSMTHVGVLHPSKTRWIIAPASTRYTFYTDVAEHHLDRYERDEARAAYLRAYAYAPGNAAKRRTASELERFTTQTTTP